MSDEQKPNEIIKVERKYSGGVLGLLSKLTDEDTIMGSVCRNVIIPRVVDTAYEGAVAALKKFFWDEDVKWSRGSGTKNSSSIIIGGHTAYNQMSSNRSGPEPSKTESRITEAIANAGRKKANSYCVQIKDDPQRGVVAWDRARDIKETLEQKMDMSGGLISVNDLYVAAGVADIPATSLDWGWENPQIKIYHDLDDDKIVIVELPRPIDIRRM